MANPELAKLQAQLRKEIQSHQYVVGRLKLEPFNADLRKQLNEQQMKIQALSDRQKWVVQDLRNELVKHEETVGKMGGGSMNVSRPLTSRSNNQQHNVLVPKLSSGSFKLVSPPTSTGQRSSHHTSSSHHSHHSSHYSNPSRMSIMTNSPIKVPTFTTVRLSSGSNKRATSPTVIQDPYKSVASNLHTAKKILRLQQQQQQAAQEALTKKADPESQKIDFMAALDLITPVMAEKLHRKRSERKRRTTANPQFSNYAKYEQLANLRRKSDSSVENGVPPDKRKRGRPPKNPDSRPATPDNSTRRDGHDDLCAVCKHTGELLLCDCCNLVYHLSCLQPPLAIIPSGFWMCPQCKAKHSGSPTQPWNGQLKVLQTYNQKKAAKDDEKKRLIRRSSELMKERIILETKAKQLNDAITDQLEAKRELNDSFKKTEATIEQLKSFLTLINSSPSTAESNLPPSSPAVAVAPPLTPPIGAPSS